LSKLSRRDLAKALGGTAAAVGVGALFGAPAVATPREQRFPEGFVWGCASAAYQSEGATQVDGRGDSNWDVFCRTPGKIKNGATGDPACDAYHRYAEDHQLLKDLGAGAYRISIAWSRIFPEGRGRVNQKGVDHYNRVIDNMLEKGIRPYITMFHWDYPAALPGGWQNRDTAYALADYAGFMASKISDRVKDIMTTNEISIFTDVAHGMGRHAPGLELPSRQLNQVRHHGVLAHGLALQSIRATAKTGTRVGFAENPAIVIPVIETPQCIAAARKAMREVNAPFMTAMMEGKYLDSYLSAQGANAPKVDSGDMSAIGAPVDFVAINLYTGHYVRPANNEKGYEFLQTLPTSPRMNHDWLVIRPEAGYWAIRHTSDLWNCKAIYISENGASATDVVTASHVDDADRVMYLRNYLTHFQRASAEGYSLKGYFLWCLMDNFEWEHGYSDSVRMGIHRVDFTTQKRTQKLSATWYKEVIRRNAVV
jgi:beta-glucosidase